MIALAGLRNFYDLLGNNFGDGIGAVHEPKDTQRILIRRRHALDFVRPEHRIFSQAKKCHDTNRLSLSARRCGDPDRKLDFAAERLAFNSLLSAAWVHMRARSSNWFRSSGTSASSACLVHSREYSQYFSDSPGMGKISSQSPFCTRKLRRVPKTRLLGTRHSALLRRSRHSGLVNPLARRTLRWSP